MNNKIFEVFDLEDLTSEELDNIYNLYKNSYEKSVGTSWKSHTFFDKAMDWQFFGDQQGYVAARPIGNGIYKLTVIGGNIRSILNGFNELKSLNKPIWGMVSKDILPMMHKLGFTTPNSFILKMLLKIAPKDMFGDADFTINSDGSITLHYGDVGNATKYFVSNQKYFNWLKTQIKRKIDPMKLSSILKGVLNEAKQRGNLYHFTPITNLDKILKTQYLMPNHENQISTSIRPNMDTIFGGEESEDRNNDMSEVPIVRLELDGDKISNKYKIRPFSWDEEDLGEEQIVVNGKNFYFMQYLKRIDIFTNNKKSKSNTAKIKKMSLVLQNLNIPYKIFDGLPNKSIPYRQSRADYLASIDYKPKESTFTYPWPADLIVKHDLILSDTKIKSLPDNLTINGNLFLENTPITSLPNNLTVNGNLYLSGTKITSLPNNLIVGQDLQCGSKINFIPANIKVGGDLDLSGTKITSLPDNLSVGNNLNISYTAITSLPDNLSVGKGLNARNTNLMEVPKNLTVNGNFMIWDTPLAANYSEEQLEKLLPWVNGYIRL